MSAAEPASYRHLEIAETAGGTVEVKVDRKLVDVIWPDQPQFLMTFDADTGVFDVYPWRGYE